MLRKLFTHTAIYGLAPHVPRLASLSILPLVTRYLVPEDYGIYGVVTSAVGLVSVLSSLGLRLILVNTYFKYPRRYGWIWGQVYGFLMLWSIPFALLTSCILWLVIPSEASVNSEEIILLNVLPLIFFGQTAMFGTTYYQVSKRPMPIAIRTIVFGLITVAANWYTIVVLHLGYMGWFWSTFIATMLNNVSYLVVIRHILKTRSVFVLRWKSIKRFLRVTMPTVPHYYSGYLLNTSDKLVLDFMKTSASDIGRYNVAYTFGNYFNALGIASGTAIGPLLNECYKENNDQRARSLIFIQQVCFLLACFVISLWMSEVFSFFFRNKSLQINFDLAIIIVMAYSYRPMYIGANAKLMFVERTRALWKVTFIAGVLNVLMNVALVPLFGYTVAAYTTFVSLMYMGYAGFFINDFKSVNQARYYPVLWLLLTVGLTALAVVSVSFDYFIKGSMTFISAVLFVLFLRKFNDFKK